MTSFAIFGIQRSRFLPNLSMETHTQKSKQTSKQVNKQCFQIKGMYCIYKGPWGDFPIRKEQSSSKSGIHLVGSTDLFANFKEKGLLSVFSSGFKDLKVHSQPGSPCHL